MKKSWVVLALGGPCLLACGDGDPSLSSIDEAIVGGVQATVGEFPTAVAVKYTGTPDPPWWCGGTLVSPTTVLTAKHCTYGLDGVTAIPTSQLTAVVGRHNVTTSAGTVKTVSSIVRHPTQDVALLRLSSAVTTVKPTRLTALGRMSEIPAGSTTTVVGWGGLSEGGVSSNTLQKVDVEVIGVGATCETLTGYPAGGVSVSSNEICIGDLAGGQDSCQGDSGGPVFVRRDGEDFLVGVTSEGFGCARPNLPGVYAYPPSFFDWFHSNMSDEPDPSLLPTAQIMRVLI